MSLGDKPAYPQNDALVNRLNNMDGMTLRQYYAGLAMQGVILNSCESDFNSAYEAVAKQSIKLADALIAALENNSEEKVLIKNNGKRLEKSNGNA